MEAVRPTVPGGSSFFSSQAREKKDSGGKKIKWLVSSHSTECVQGNATLGRLYRTTSIQRVHGKGGIFKVEGH